MASNEIDWIADAQNGDEEAFANLVTQYQNPVYNLCYRMLGNPQEAEDAAQETFWRAFQAIRRYDRSRPFPTWLLSIAAHYCIDQQRKRRLPSLDIEDWMEEILPDNEPSPEHVAGESQQNQILHRLLNELNPQDRAALILRYWYEFSEDEISQALKMSGSAVKSRLHRARLKMAALIQAEQDSTGERIQDKITSLLTPGY